MCFIQTAWHWLEIVTILASIALWFAVAAIVNVIVLVDYDFFEVRTRQRKLFS